jgi:hypothetical protein
MLCLAGPALSGARWSVVAVTTATGGHAPVRLAGGCEPPIAATSNALSAAAAAGPDACTGLARTRCQPQRTAFRPADAGRSAARRGPPGTRPGEAIADEKDVGVPLIGPHVAHWFCPFRLLGRWRRTGCYCGTMAGAPSRNTYF